MEVEVKQENLKWIIICNILGLLLFGSWFITHYQGFWFEIDKAIFYLFNEQLVLSKAFMYFVAFVNLRAFDIVAFLAMLGIFYSYYRKSNVEGKRWLFCVGVAMLFSAIIMKQFDRMLEIERESASIFLEQMYHNVHFVSELSGWPAKDQSGSSFPGDHGMMLLIFVAYMWKYMDKGAFWKSLAVFVLFSFPRIMSGAHWFSDIFVGSVSFALVILSWILLSPAADIVIEWLEKRVPLRYFVMKR